MPLGGPHQHLAQLVRGELLDELIEAELGFGRRFARRHRDSSIWEPATSRCPSGGVVRVTDAHTVPDGRLIFDGPAQRPSGRPERVGELSPCHDVGGALRVTDGHVHAGASASVHDDWARDDLAPEDCATGEPQMHARHAATRPAARRH